MEIFAVLLLLFQTNNVSLEEEEEDIPIHVECGTVQTDHVNVSYYGEAARFYSTENELECASVEIEHLHKLYNVNNREECGVQWNNMSTSFTLRVRVQMQHFLVTDDDQVYVIKCDYSPNILTNQRVSVALYENFMTRILYTQQVRTTTVETLRNAFYLYLRNATTGRELVDSPVAGDAVVIEISNPTWSKETLQYMFVEECMIKSTDATPSFSLQLLALGCGSGSVIPRDLYFNISGDGTGLRSPKFFYPILPDFYDYVVIECSVYLSYPVKPAHLSEICPIGGESNGTHLHTERIFEFPNFERDGIDSIIGALTSIDTSKVKDLNHHLKNSEKQQLLAVLLGSSVEYRIDNGNFDKVVIKQNETIRYISVQGNAPSAKRSPTIDTSVHYLIITCVLSFLLVVFAVINLYLFRILINRKVECCEGCEHSSHNSSSSKLFDADFTITKL